MNFFLICLWILLGQTRVCTFEELFTPIFQEHKEQLNNLNRKNPPLMILISGTPGMGKSVVARTIEEQLKGVRIVSDDIRRLFAKHGLKSSKKASNDMTYLENYYYYCSKEYDKVSSNGLIIFDMGADRNYDIIQDLAKKKEIPTFLIRLIVPREIVEKRIREREGDLADNYFRFLDKWFETYQKFGEEHEADYILDNGEETDFTPLLQAIKKRLNIK